MYAGRCTNVQVVYTITIGTCYTVNIPDECLPTTVVTGLYLPHSETVRHRKATCALVLLGLLIVKKAEQ